MKKKQMRWICLAAVLVMLTGCARARQDKEKPLIGISMCSLLVERWYKDREAFLAELSRLGADVIVQNANNDAQLQAEQIDDLIDKGIDALIVTPVISTVIAPAIARAKEQGISVIAYERLIGDVELDAYYSFDNVRVGELMALGLLDGMERGNVMLINGDENDHNTTLYQTGYQNILNPHIEKGNIHIVAEAYCENWEMEYAYAAVAEALERGLHIDGVIATNDTLAGAAIQALSEKGIAGQTIVIGQDGDLAAYQRIVEGVQYATVYKQYNKLASATALAAYRMSRGKPFAYSSTIRNGKDEIKYYKLTPQLVTAENIDETVVDGGVYTEREVYINVIQ